MPDTALSVTQLNEYVKTRLSQDPLLKNAVVKGEISEYKLQAGSGHAYFTLKDEKAALKAVMFRSPAAAPHTQPPNNAAVSRNAAPRIPEPP